MTITTENPYGLIVPIAVLPGMLISSTVSDADVAAWRSDLNYNVPGTLVSRGTTQKCYEVVKPSVIGDLPPELRVDGPAPYWKESLTHATAWSVTTSYPKGGRARLDSTHMVYEALIAHQGTLGGASTVTISVASPAVITWTGHTLPAGAEVIFSTTANLPSGLYPGTPYYVVSPATNTFSVSADPQGTAIATTGTQAGTHTATASSTSPEVSLDGDNAKWLELGATNLYASLDDSWGTQTFGLNTLTIVIAPGQVVDSLGLLNVLGAHISVACTLPGNPVPIYSRELTLQTDIGVYDWATYFLAPIVAEKDVTLTDLLPYYQQIITITITGPSAVAIGNISMGRYIKFGALEFSPKAGINSFSGKEQDRYGRIRVKPGAFAKRMSGRVIIDTSFVDQCTSILEQVRDIPVIYIGAGNLFSCLVIWGFFKDFEVDIAYPDVSYCTLNVEGLV